MTITPLPAAPNRNQTEDAFVSTADAFLAALPTMVTQINSTSDDIEADEISAAASASTATTAASTAVAARDATIAASDAIQWVSGASYTEGDVVWSPVNYQTYRAKTTHSSVSTDPSADTTNWELISRNDLSGDVVIGGDLDVTGELVATSYNETFASVTSTSNTTTINCETGNVFSHTLTENTTFTFSNPPTSGTAYGMTLKVVQDSTARTITWPASVDWVAGFAPTLSAGSGDVDVFVFFTHDGGTTWYGFIAGQDLS